MTQEDEKRSAELRISGMSCATCAVNLEKALKGEGRVESATVNLASETAHVAYKPSVTNLADIEAAVRKAGYQVVYDQATIKVGGMVCATCVETIEAVLKALPGVLQANPSDHEVALVTPSAEELLASVVSRANELGIKIHSVDMREPNLEAVFLHLTGRALRD